jgi:serine/threonine protein kinase
LLSDLRDDLQLDLQVDFELRRRQDYEDMKLTMQLNANFLIDEARLHQENQQELKLLLDTVSRQQIFMNERIVAMGHPPLTDRELMDVQELCKHITDAIELKLKLIMDEMQKVNGAVIDVHKQVLLMDNKLTDRAEKERIMQERKLIVQNLNISHMKDEVRIISERIGEGGFGSVCLAVKKDYSDVRFAVKVFKDVTPGGKATIENEALIMRLLESHTNIILCYGYMHHLGESWIVMEHAIFGSVGAVLDKESLFDAIPLYIKILWLRDSINGLAYMHSLGILHKDIKPDNLLVVSDLTVKLCDFGLSKELESDRARTTGIAVKGTHAFMAPEQKEKGGGSSRQSDVYSWGITALHILWGKNFGNDNAIQILNQVTSRIENPKMRAQLRNAIVNNIAADRDLRSDTSDIYESLLAIEELFPRDIISRLRFDCLKAFQEYSQQSALEAVNSFSAAQSSETMTPKDQQSSTGSAKSKISNDFDGFAEAKAIMIDWLKTEAKLEPFVCPIIASNLIAGGIYSIREIAHYFKRNDVSKLTSIISPLHLEEIVQAMLRCELVYKDCEAVRAFLPTQTSVEYASFPCKLSYHLYLFA